MPSLKLLPTIFIEALVDMDVIMESAMKTLEEEALEPIYSGYRGSYYG